MLTQINLVADGRAGGKSVSLKSLSFPHWDVSGLLSKLSDKDFISYINSFDFISYIIFSISFILLRPFLNKMSLVCFESMLCIGSRLLNGRSPDITYLIW